MLQYVASNHNDKIRSCDRFIFIAQFWPHWKPQTAQKNSPSHRSSIYNSTIPMTSPPCNKCKRIIPSFLLSVNYRQSNYTLNYYTVHVTFKHSDHVSFNRVEFPCYTAEVIACNNQTDLWVTLDQPDNELSNFTGFYVTYDRSRNKLHQIIMQLTNLVTFHDIIIIVKLLYKATSRCRIVMWSFIKDCDITFMFKM